MLFCCLRDRSGGWTGPSFGSEEVVLDRFVSGVGCGERHLGHRCDLLPSLFGAKLLDATQSKEGAKLMEVPASRAEHPSEIFVLARACQISVWAGYPMPVGLECQRGNEEQTPDTHDNEIHQK